MSSGSNLSWCTADNEPNECVEFLDGKKLNSKVSYVEGNEFRPQKTNIYIQNDQNALESDVEIQQNTRIASCCYCCKKSLKIIRRIKGLYALKMPWIIILLSIIQVCMAFVTFND